MEALTLLEQTVEILCLAHDQRLEISVGAQFAIPSGKTNTATIAVRLSVSVGVHGEDVKQV